MHSVEGNTAGVHSVSVSESLSVNVDGSINTHKYTH